MSSRLAVVGFIAMLCAATTSLSSQTKIQPAPAKTSAARTVGPVTPPATDAAKIKSALSAAPAAVAKDATVVDINMQTMASRVLKQGTNGWTCIPDGPSPGIDPMCLDKNGMEWADAWMHHKDPPKDKIAVGYMLMGGSDASNTDPFAEKPNPGDRWVETGPHLMVMNIGDHFAGYPTTAANTKVPYVMYANTPYAHLMVPVK
jgi:hypothetical protein